MFVSSVWFVCNICVWLHRNNLGIRRIVAEKEIGAIIASGCSGRESEELNIVMEFLKYKQKKKQKYNCWNSVKKKTDANSTQYKMTLEKKKKKHPTSNEKAWTESHQ